MEEIGDEADSLRTQIHALEGTLTQKRSELDAMGEEMKSEKQRGDTSGYNSRIARYNAGVREYNSLLSRLSGMVARYNRLVEVYNTLASHQYDRKGMYAWLVSTGDPGSIASR